MRSPKTRHLHLYQKYLNLRKRFFKKNHRKAVISRMYRPTWHNFLSITIFFIKKKFFCKSEYKNLSRRINRGKTDRKRRPAFFAAYLPSPDNSWPSYGIILILLKHRELSRLTFGYPSCWVVAVRFQFCRSEVNWPYCKLCPNSRNIFISLCHPHSIARTHQMNLPAAGKRRLRATWYQNLLYGTFTRGKPRGIIPKVRLNWWVKV